MEEKLIKLTEDTIERQIAEGLTTNNLDIVYKLVDIYKDAKEVKNMNYGNYNNYGREQYGEYDGYGARQRDSRGRYMGSGYGRRYRGHDHLERMEDEYSRYSENREKYGASQDTDRSFYYMVEALKDFIKVIEQEADSQQQKQMLRDALQQSMM